MFMDIITGIGFLNQLSSMPWDYQMRIDKLLKCANDIAYDAYDNNYAPEWQEITYNFCQEAAAVTEYFRQESIKYAFHESENTYKVSDQNALASAMLMLLVVLDEAFVQYCKKINEVKKQELILN